MIIMRTITVTGKYTGQDKRGTIIGGMLFKAGAKEQTVEVTEETYLKLKSGTENGWFQIIKDNYDVFLMCRKGCLGSAKPAKSECTPAPVKEEKPQVLAEIKAEEVAEVKAEEVAEAKAEEVVEAKPKTKGKAKSKAKEEAETEK